MYAIIQTGGKQYKAEAGRMIQVEKLNAEVGAQLEFDALLISGDGTTEIGTPIVEGQKVVAKVVEHGKAKKVIVFKYKSKKDYKKKQGHRQPYTKLEVVSIG